MENGSKAAGTRREIAGEIAEVTEETGRSLHRDLDESYLRMVAIDESLAEIIGADCPGRRQPTSRSA